MRTGNGHDILKVFLCFGNRHWIAIVVQPAGSSNIAVRRTELARIVSNPTGPVAARTALHALTPQKRNHSAGVLSTCSRIFLISSLLVVEISFVMPGTYTVILSVALNYGGRAEIVDAARAAIRRLLDEGTRPDELTEERITNELYTRTMPDLDLLVRTSGELRISNFLLWQAAYSEIYVTETFWPDFRRVHLLEAIVDYQRRDRPAWSNAIQHRSSTPSRHA